MVYEFAARVGPLVWNDAVQWHHVAWTAGGLAALITIWRDMRRMKREEVAADAGQRDDCFDRRYASGTEVRAMVPASHMRWKSESLDTAAAVRLLVAVSFRPTSSVESWRDGTMETITVTLD